MQQDGALSGMEVAGRLAEGSGQPYAQFIHIDAEGRPQDVGYERLSRGDITDIDRVPINTDLVKLWPECSVIYVGGKVLTREEIAQIPTHNMTQAMAASLPLAAGVVRLGSGFHEVEMLDGGIHIPLDPEGRLLFDQATFF
jgi:hypothetical protein